MSSPASTQFGTFEKFANQESVLSALVQTELWDDALRGRIVDQAAKLVERIRQETTPTLMESFQNEYALSTDEGVALMCLAEAMLRIPDAANQDALIRDKIVPGQWNEHLNSKRASTFVNASTWALMLTGKVLEEPEGQQSITRAARTLFSRMSEPAIRTAVGEVMKQMGHQFVLGETIGKAIKRGDQRATRDYLYSFDMLGEAAVTQGDADRYFDAYSNAIAEIAKHCDSANPAENPGISIKLSALHLRYEVAQSDRVLAELVPQVLALSQMAKTANMGLNIDAEEQDRLVLSLQVIQAVLADESLAGWDGFGVVVQAYGKRAGAAIDWLYDLATNLDRKIMVRLVKGAYWDSEIKLAQVEGLADYPVFTSKAATDVSYLANAAKLFGYSDRIYPQFATHNAHTVAAVLEIAQAKPFEFQRLHGMGERLHEIVRDTHGTPCRIYAPVGQHVDLLAYLVRRLLENGANSSFVNLLVDDKVPARDIVADPFAMRHQPDNLARPSALFAPQRTNSKGFDLSDLATLQDIEDARLAAAELPTLRLSDRAEVEAIDGIIAQAEPWAATARQRANILNKAADLYEANYGALFACLAKEAGKTLLDAVGELREAVDFLRFYAAQSLDQSGTPRGKFVAISPWNFPLAIFTGQIAAGLATGNAMLAKPAESTPLIAQMAVDLMHQAGVPKSALQLVQGTGRTVGNALTKSPDINGVVFTGSTATAKLIQRNLAEFATPGTPLIAETGGLNAMIVDSSALLEQAVNDIIASAFQSAGQRCSALRCLYVQREIADDFLAMLTGAMDQLAVGDPWHLSTDVGPVIDQAAFDNISSYIATQKVIHQAKSPSEGLFIAPTLIEVGGIGDLAQEIFGPVLHVARFDISDLDKVIEHVNASGYGLTFGLHTRIGERVDRVVERVNAGNIYVNRNQIGAVVGSQPFGGEGLSGTGPKAGGPLYLGRFCKSGNGSNLPSDKLAMPGPTGELNEWWLTPRPPILCLGPGVDAQVETVTNMGGNAVTDADFSIDDLGAVWFGGEAEKAREIAVALAKRDGPIVPLVVDHPDPAHVFFERALCVDTTAAGGNASLLAGNG